jgi:hypothetical protein
MGDIDSAGLRKKWGGKNGWHDPVRGNGLLVKNRCGYLDFRLRRERPNRQIKWQRCAATLSG